MGAPSQPLSASAEIDEKLARLNDWRGDALRRIRKLILETDMRIVEEVKWRKPSNPSGVPVWSCAGIICTGEVYKSHVKLTFAKGGSLEDPAKLFSEASAGGVRRAIDLQEGEKLNAAAFKRLVRAAIALNNESKASKKGS